VSDDQLPNLRGGEGQQAPGNPGGAASGAGPAGSASPGGAPGGAPAGGGGAAAPPPSGSPGAPRQSGASGGSLAAVMQLEVPVSIELGRTRMAVEDVLALGRGSVVQLDRLVGQPVEVFVSDKPFATGEVVVMGEKFGVRIIRIREPVQASEIPS